ncbi:hypothetical protein V8E51_002661 [Hyaloscypha variabilis]
MGSYREILHAQASNRPPYGPNRWDEFDVAILPYFIPINRCSNEHFNWVKVPGRTSAGMIRKVYSESKAIGREVLFVNGTEVVKDDAEIRLFDHFGSGIVVFWTIRPDAIPAFKDQLTASEKQAEHSRSVQLREKAVVQQRIIEQEKAPRENKDDTSMPLIKLLDIRTGVGNLCKDTLIRLCAFPESRRCSEWLLSMLEEDPEGQTDLHTLWQAYHTCFGSLVRKTRVGLLDNAEFQERILYTFPGKASVQAGVATGRGQRIVIEGIRPRTPINSNGNKCSHQTDVKQPTIDLEWTIKEKDALTQRVRDRMPLEKFLYKVAGEGGPAFHCRNSCKCIFPLYSESESEFWSMVAKLAVHVASKEMVYSSDLYEDDFPFSQRIEAITVRTGTESCMDSSWLIIET